MQFPIKLGAKNGGNARVIRGLANGTFRQGFAGDWWYEQRVRLVGRIRDFTPDADTSQVLNLNTLFPSNVFPERVIRSVPLIEVVSNPAGPSLTALAVIMGDAADDNGLVTSTNIIAAAGTHVQTIAAAEFADRYEAAYVPLVQLDATGANLDAITNLDFIVKIKFSPVVEA